MRPFSEVKDELAKREEGKQFEETMRTYLADLEERAYLVESTPPEAAGYREVTRDTGNDPLAAFAPKRAPAATPAPAPVAPAPPVAPPASETPAPAPPPSPAAGSPPA